MREAAADLEFEEAARLRDEVKRLRAIELAVMDDPTAKAVASLARRGGGAERRAARAAESTSPSSTRWASRSTTRASPIVPAPARRRRASRRSTRWAPAPDNPNPIAPERARPPAAPACAAALSRGEGNVTHTVCGFGEVLFRDGSPDICAGAVAVRTQQRENCASSVGKMTTSNCHPSDSP